MKTNMLKMILFALTALVNQACNKNVDPHIPPAVAFTTSAPFLYSDSTVSTGDTLKTELTATKTEDDLKSYNISVAYDGASTTSTFYNYLVESSEYEGFTQRVDIITRNVAGTEKWIFSVVDRDGNITQKQILLTVE